MFPGLRKYCDVGRYMYFDRPEKLQEDLSHNNTCILTGRRIDKKICQTTTRVFTPAGENTRRFVTQQHMYFDRPEKFQEDLSHNNTCILTGRRIDKKICQTTTRVLLRPEKIQGDLSHNYTCIYSGRRNYKKICHTN